MTEGLARLSGVTIQTLVAKGKSGNLDSQNIADWIERIKQIRPLFVQLYTLDREAPAKDLLPVSVNELDSIKKQVLKTGISAEIF